MATGFWSLNELDASAGNGPSKRVGDDAAHHHRARRRDARARTESYEQRKAANAQKTLARRGGPLQRPETDGHVGTPTLPPGSAVTAVKQCASSIELRLAWFSLKENRSCTIFVEARNTVEPLCTRRNRSPDLRGFMPAKDWTLPFPLPGGFSGRVLAGIHALRWPGAACAITVAGQWRSFTALPEHSVAGKGCGCAAGRVQRQPQELR